MNVCGLPVNCLATHHADIVYRVHWLCTKALRDCWAKELLLVQHEMDWTCTFFSHKEEEWIGLQTISKQEEKEGHVAYAARQSKIYQRLHAEARCSFDQIRASCCSEGHIRL
ncbi:hypothetical protein F4604DRAFT_1594724 [Suillus subluteus]|nr:hypothetical protein F4604DRAFT_1594724 [Suillus subluteus]